MFQKFWICQKRLFLRCRQDTQTVFPFGFAVCDTGIQQVCRISMSFEGTGHPQTVNVHISIRRNGIPSIFSRYILNKALSSLNTFQKNQTFCKAILQPCFFGGYLNILIFGNRTADMLLLYILICYLNVFLCNYLLILLTNK